MRGTGWVFMLISWVTLLGGLTYCLTKVLSRRSH